MRFLLLPVSAAIVLWSAIGIGWAQDVENGQRLSERWCSACHAIGPAPVKSAQVQSFASIVARPGISSEMIASFLLLPHATMPNLPLSRKDAQDIAVFIVEMKK